MSVLEKEDHQLKVLFGHLPCCIDGCLCTFRTIVVTIELELALAGVSQDPHESSPVRTSNHNRLNQRSKGSLGPTSSASDARSASTPPRYGKRLARGAPATTDQGPVASIHLLTQQASAATDILKREREWAASARTRTGTSTSPNKQDALATTHTTNLPAHSSAFSR